MKNIILIGMMGCGKTTVGKLLADKLGISFLDVDAYIEAHHGSISCLFEKGQEHFRDLESQAVMDMASLTGHVISTGGGVVLRKENVEVLRESGFVFYLDRPLAQIIKTIDPTHRPLLKNGVEVLHDLYLKRHSLYLSACHFKIDASQDALSVCNAITEIIDNHGLSD